MTEFSAQFEDPQNEFGEHILQNHENWWNKNNIEEISKQVMDVITREDTDETFQETNNNTKDIKGKTSKGDKENVMMN